MRHSLMSVLGSILIVTACGCNGPTVSQTIQEDDPVESDRVEKMYMEVILCMNELSAVLEDVKNANSGRAAIPQIEATASKIKELTQNGDKLVDIIKLPTQASVRVSEKVIPELEKVNKRLDRAQEQAIKNAGPEVGKLLENAMGHLTLK